MLESKGEAFKLKKIAPTVKHGGGITMPWLCGTGTLQQSGWKNED